MKRGSVSVGAWPAADTAPEPFRETKISGRPRYRAIDGRVMTGYRPFCSTLISPPTELVNWLWHVCWADTVFALFMQV